MADRLDLRPPSQVPLGTGGRRIHTPGMTARIAAMSGHADGSVSGTAAVL